MKIRLGICGAGKFASYFIPLFAAHPAVGEVALCDLDADKLARRAEQFGIARTFASLDELCRSDVDAIAIFTQNLLHGPQAVQALRAGKHVYSAVPSANTLEEMTSLVRAVEETGRIYMIGETSYYYPSAIYCRERFQKGDFGHVAYAEAEYYHDMDNGLYDVLRWRYGADWEKYAGHPPMFYPTHSVSLVTSVTGARATHVSCLGWRDQSEDGLFRAGTNIWDNEWSNQTALCRMSDGGIARFNEFRRIAAQGERLRLYGTAGAYEETFTNAQWVDKNEGAHDLTAMLSCRDEIAFPESGMANLKEDAVHKGVSSVHPVASLPQEFQGLPNGHNGSHQFLVHEFVTCCAQNLMPANNVWQAARYLLPGLTAHESAKQNGAMLEIPDFGDAPPDSKYFELKKGKPLC